MATVSSLGPLEQEVMSCLWQHKRQTVRDVYQCLRHKRKIAYTTVMTIMNRLTKKSLLVRKKVGKAYSYSAKQTKKEVVQDLVHKTISDLVKRYGSEAIAAFADEIERLPPKKRKKLIAQLKEE